MQRNKVNILSMFLTSTICFEGWVSRCYGNFTWYTSFLFLCIYDHQILEFTINHDSIWCMQLRMMIHQTWNITWKCLPTKLVKLLNTAKFNLISIYFNTIFRNYILIHMWILLKMSSACGCDLQNIFLCNFSPNKMMQ